MALDQFLNIAADIANVVMAITAVIVIIIEYIRNRKSIKQKTAHSISAWIESEYIAADKIFSNVILSNASNVPIYDVFVSVDINGRSFEENINKYDFAFINVLPQGKYIISVPNAGHGGGISLASSITFRDEYGQVWSRFSNGKLKMHHRYWKHDKKFLPHIAKETSYTVRKIDPPIPNSTIETWKQN